MSMNIYIVCVKCLKLAIVINEDLFNWNGYINILTYNGVLYTCKYSVNLLIQITSILILSVSSSYNFHIMPFVVFCV